MVLKVAKRGAIPPFIVMDVMRAANEREAQGEEVLHLEVGQPGTSAPKPVLEAAKEALTDDLLGYTDALGTGLRNIIKSSMAFASRRTGLSSPPVLQAGSCWRSYRPLRPATGLPWLVPAIPPTGIF